MFADSATFVTALVLVSVASLVLSTSLERIGVRLNFTHALLGIVTALGADAPEIAASITALHAGRAQLGYGIVVGSSVFNLAALLGAAAIATGVVRITWRATLFNGTVAVAVTLATALVLLGAIPPWAGPIALALVFIPYVILCALGRDRLAWLARVPRLRAILAAALGAQQTSEPSDTSSARPATTFDMLATVPALATIVVGSIAMVRTARSLGGRFGLGDVVTGSLVLAALTGIPNLVAALRLARKQQGAVVISEAFNSNTLTLAAGIILPVWLFGPQPVDLATRMAVGWLVVMTIGAVAMTLRRPGLHRIEGVVLVAAYAGFMAAIVGLVECGAS